MDRPAGHPPEVWRERTASVLSEVASAGRFDARAGLFGTRRPFAGRTYEHLWPFTCAWSAAETAATLGGELGGRAAALAASAFQGLQAYGRRSGPGAPSGGSGPVAFESSVTPPLGRGGEIYYDDNAWVALALVEHHRRTGDAAPLTLARDVVAFCCTGWSTAAWARPGGIRWKVPAASRSRNTCANGPVAEAAALVHAATGDPRALEWAVRIYDWVRGALLDPNGLYLDRIAPDGTRAPDRWTYNQGTMIGAGVLLSDATRNSRYLDEARATAAAALARFDVEALLAAGSPAFHAIYFRNLFLLDRRVHDPRIAAAATAYGDRTWEQWRRWRSSGGSGARRARGSLFGSRPLVRRSRAAALNARAPLAEIYALLAGASPHP